MRDWSWTSTLVPVVHPSVTSSTVRYYYIPYSLGLGSYYRSELKKNWKEKDMIILLLKDELLICEPMSLDPKYVSKTQLCI